MTLTMHEGNVAPLIHIQLLGGMRVTGADGREALRIPGQARSLLAYLLLYSHISHQREALADTLWPDADPSRARRTISDALYRLRQALGDAWVTPEQSRLTLQLAALHVDLWEFERLISTGTLANLRAALELYRGELLPEIYDDWILARRIALREQYLSALLQIATSAEEQGDLYEAASFYHQLIATDPLREEAYRGLMRCLALQGRLADAIAISVDLEQLLDAELGLPPTDETRALAEQLRTELLLKRQATHVASSNLTRPPFIGRVSERMQLLARLDSARGSRGGIVVVLGDAGIGKTRLLEEVAAAATWRGWQIAWGRGEELNLPPPYAPLRQALAAALPRPRIQQLQRLVPAQWIDLLAQIAPEIAEITGFATAADQLAPQDVQQLTRALTRTLGGLAQIAPHLIILDNMQSADPALWPLLDSLREPLAAHGVLIILAVRADELRAQADIWHMVEAWDRASDLVVSLSGLGRSDLTELAIACGLRDEQQEQYERLYTASGGNPLLALSLLREGNLNAPAPSLAELTLRRLALLSGEARRALQCAAVLGYQFDYTLWEAVGAQMRLPADLLPALAGSLEQHGVIVLERSDYRFAHDTLRTTVYAHIPDTIRRSLHQHVLAILIQQASSAPQLRLYHAEHAGDRQAIAQYALEAGAQALASFSPRAAVRHYTQALDAIATDDLLASYSALLGRAQALDRLADRDAEQHDLNRLRALAERLEDPQRRIEVARRQAMHAWHTGALEAADAAAAHGLALARAAGDILGQAALLETAGRIARDRGDYPQAHALFLEARTRYGATASRFGEAVITDLLGGLAWSVGDYPQAAELHAAAATLFCEMGHLYHEARSLNNLGSAFWGMGDFAQARATHERGIVVCREIDDRLSESHNLDNLGGVEWVLGDYRSAIEYYSQALAIRRAAGNAWGISVSLGNLGSAHRLLGEIDTALRYYAEALDVNRAMGRRRGEGFVQHGRGMAFLDAGRLAEAHTALAEARAIRVELNERDNLIETDAALTLAFVAAGDLTQARHHIDAALTRLDMQRDRATLRQFVHFAASTAAAALDRHSDPTYHLRLAHQAMLEVAASLPADARTQYLTNVPLNRQTLGALAALKTRVQVRLARASTPLGRKLTTNDYVTINWTVAAPEDDLIAAPDERRRSVIQRLLDEAATHDAAPTDADLATALGVSRRTILRDMARLSSSATPPITRRRRS